MNTMSFGFSKRVKFTYYTMFQIMYGKKRLITKMKGICEFTSVSRMTKHDVCVFCNIVYVYIYF